MNPTILKRADYIASVRSDISEYQSFLADAEHEVKVINDRIIFAEEQKLGRFKKLEKAELKILKRRMKRARKSIKELTEFLALAENTLG